MLLFSNIKHFDTQQLNAENYSISSLDVPDSFPISISKLGIVQSIFSDTSWNLTPYANRNSILHFDIKTKAGRRIDTANIARYKKLMLWVMYAWRYPLSTSSILSRAQQLRLLFKLCIDNQIDIANLSRFPSVFEQLPRVTTSSVWRQTRHLLKMIHGDRTLIGFYILTNAQIDQIDRQFVTYSTAHQTPFIPPRILDNILSRCFAVVNGYLDNQKQVDDFYNTCLDVFKTVRYKSGSRQKLSTVSKGKRRALSFIETQTGKKFSELAVEYGVKEVMSQVLPKDKNLYICNISSYLSNVSLAAQILIGALTGMRNIEHGLLRKSCHVIRDDEVLGRVHFLIGKTTKTKRDSHAYWITSSATEIAIKAASAISTLRTNSTNTSSDHKTEDDDSSFLFTATSEPWTYTNRKKSSAKNPIPATLKALSNRLETFPHLLPPQLLNITIEDLEASLRLNPDLDLNKFRVNAPWPLAWHQFRRTLACNAIGDGVSLSSMAWQLKHSRTAMTLHYANNYFSVPMDKSLKKEFEDAQVEISRIKLAEMNSDKYLTAEGINKNSVLRTAKSFNGESFPIAVLDGRINIKNTALGVCTNPSPCEFGGWENVSECVRCANGLIYKANRPRINRMLEIIDADLADCNDVKDFLLIESLNAQKKALVEALNAIG